MNVARFFRSSPGLVEGQQSHKIQHRMGEDYRPEAAGSGEPPAEHQPQRDYRDRPGCALIEVVRDPDRDADVDRERRAPRALQCTDHVRTDEYLFEDRIDDRHGQRRRQRDRARGEAVRGRGEAGPRNFTRDDDHLICRVSAKREKHGRKQVAAGEAEPELREAPAAGPQPRRQQGGNRDLVDDEPAQPRVGDGRLRQGRRGGRQYGEQTDVNEVAERDGDDNDELATSRKRWHVGLPAGNALLGSER